MFNLDPLNLPEQKAIESHYVGNALLRQDWLHVIKKREGIGIIGPLKGYFYYFIQIQ